MLEAVRQNGDALKHASEELRQYALLQPASVRMNALAVQGSVAPVCAVLSLELAEPAIRYKAALGLGGSEISGEILSGASLGDLASTLRDHMRSNVIYLLLPGQDQPVSPLFVQSPLRDFCDVIET